MKYEFHVGDYVETKGGAIGYFNSIGLTGKEGQVTWVCDKSGNLVRLNAAVVIDDLIRVCVRIGQYDFTKPEPLKEIDALPESWMDTIEHRKINELITTVNKLRKDYNEHLAACKQCER